MKEIEANLYDVNVSFLSCLSFLFIAALKKWKQTRNNPIALGNVLADFFMSMMG